MRNLSSMQVQELGTRRTCRDQTTLCMCACVCTCRMGVATVQPAALAMPAEDLATLEPTCRLSGAVDECCESMHA